MATTATSDAIADPVDQIPASAIGNGKKTVTTAGTSETLIAGSTLCRAVTIKALSTNTGIVFVGSSTVSSANGFQLSAKETITIPIDDLLKIFLDVSVNGEGVSFIFIK